jgi:DNA invertase Pin-like site-specific DNA recombinase
MTDGMSKSQKTRRGAVYARVSTDEQAKEGRASIPHQIEQCKALAASDKIPVAQSDIFTDDMTGRTMTRPGLSVLLERLDEFSHVYCYDSTRLGRRLAISSAIRDLIEDSGASLRMVAGDTSEMDDESRALMAGVSDVLSEAEVRKLVRRARFGREARTRSGLPSGRPLAGWRLIRDDRGKVIGAEVDPLLDRFYRDFEALLLQGHAYNSIAHLLQDRGHVNPNTGRMWEPPTLSYLARHPWNMGHAVYGLRGRVKGWEKVTVENVHAPRWRDPVAVARELERREALRGRGRWQRSKFGGILRCAFCGSSMIGAGVEKRQVRGELRVYMRYLCGRHAQVIQKRSPKSADCQPNQITERATIEQLSAWFLRMATPKGVDVYLRQMQKDGQGAAAAEVKRLARELAAVKRKQAKLIDRLAVVPDRLVPDVRDRLSTLDDQRAGLEQAIGEAQKAAAAVPDLDRVRVHLLELAPRAAELLIQAPPPAVRAALHQVFPQGIPVQKGQLLL